MRRPELESHMVRIASLTNEMQKFVPESLDPRRVDFRADLAGLLTVTIVASYESCVKETLLKFASRHHPKFAGYVSENYKQLNSRIRVNDLHKYCKTFDPLAHDKFKNLLKDRKKKISDKIGQNIEDAYDQMLDWRHDFAHAANRNTTIEEAIKRHWFARHVLFTFYDAFV